jgi:hypothetical protein
VGSRQFVEKPGGACPYDEGRHTMTDINRYNDEN